MKANTKRNSGYMDDSHRPRWNENTEPLPDRCYVYKDEFGNALFETEKGINPDGGKPWRVRWLSDDPTMDRSYYKAEQGNTPWALFRLPELKAIKAGSTLYIPEGEKDVETLRALGLTATCNPCGANKWRDEFSPEVSGHHCVILVDNDEVGEKHADKVARSIQPFAASVRIVRLPGLGEKQDVTDWFEQHSLDELLAIVAATPNRVPAIDVDLPIHELADECERALVEAGSEIYARGGQLVAPVVDRFAASDGRETTSPRLVTVSADRMIDLLSKSTRFERIKRSKKGDYPVRTDPPRSAAQIVLARDGVWKFKTLTGVISCPTLRRDGSIVSKPGFDEETGLFLVNVPELPEMSEWPTKADAEAAIKRLDALLDGFCFADPDNDKFKGASRSVALSMLITPVVRGVMAVAPMHVVRAPMAGSGKSFLVDLASAIVTGQAASIIDAGKSSEETDKRLESALLSGLPLLSIDNVNGKLGSDFLNQAISQTRVSIRQFHTQKLIETATRTCLMATGNNIIPTGDMGRRILLCELDPKTAKPEQRSFDFNPFARVIDDRASYIADALTVVRAVILDKDLTKVTPLASFEDWSDTVRSALVWLGYTDPVITQEAARNNDPEKMAFDALLATWKAAIGCDRAMTSAELIEESRRVIIDESDFRPIGLARLTEEEKERINNFRAALTEVLPEVEKRKLTAFLGEKANNYASGVKLIAFRDSSSKIMKYKIVDAN